MSLYKLTNGKEVIILSKKLTITEGGHGWKEYKDWLAKGNTPDPADIIDPMIEVRLERDVLLKESDMWMVSDFPIGTATLTKIKTYRKTLRELPTVQPNVTIKTVVFPTRPGTL